MTFSIPQPIPSRSSHPVHAHQRPTVRRSQSHTASSTATVPQGGISSTKYGLSRLLATSDHHLHQPDIGDDLTLTNDEDDIEEEDDEDDDDDDIYIANVRVDSGHYSGLDAAESRGIPIGKPSFLMHQKNSGHLYGTAGGSVDSRSRLSQDMQNASSRYRYSHSHSNSDSHHSINLIADNLRAAAAVSGASSAKNEAAMTGTRAGASNNTQDPSVQQLAHFQYQQQQHERHSNNGPASPSNILTCSPSAPAASLPSPLPSPISIAVPQRALRRGDDAHIGQFNSSSRVGSEHSNCINNNTHVNTSLNIDNTINGNPNTNAKPDMNTGTVHHTHPHAHPSISIDTSKARLQKAEAAAAKMAMAKPSAQELSRPTPPTSATSIKRAVSASNLPRSKQEGQISFGLKREDKALSTPSISTSAAPAPTSNSNSTRPLMMASQSRLSSALPPVPLFSQPSMGAQGLQSPVLLPSLSPSSPRANSALVNSLEQLSVSWKAPEHTPSFPINRLHRSRTISSGARPNFNSSFSSNGTLGSSISTNQYQSSVMSPSTMVTSSSYSSLPYSPAVAFLSNFVEVTAPRMAPDEEGEQVGDFIMGKIIGHGGFSLVREAFAIHLDGMVAQVAVKIVKTQTGATDNDRVQRMLDKEVAIWSRLSHPNVLPFLAVEKLPTDTFVFCELCTGGHLLDYLTRQEASSYLSPRAGRTVGLDETHARLIFNQVAEALRYLHEEKRIVHRDIKLENILQHEDGTWKICDFGLAEYQNDEAAFAFGSPLSPTIYNPRASSGNVHGSPSSARSQGSLGDNDGCFDAGMEVEEVEEDDEVGGSLAYCSPEQLRSPKPLRCPSSDVWSLGVVLYALLTGRLPFQDEYEPRLQHQILNGRYEDPTECSAEARDLLKNMFRSKPEDRWRIGQVIDSPWCLGTTLESTSSFGDFGGGNGNNGGTDHAKMNNFFASFKF